MIPPQLRILVPAYNESERIEPMLADYCEQFRDTAIVTVIANACTDQTIPVIRNLMNQYPNLDLVVINGRVGKGGAIRAGLKTGNEPYVGFADADGSTSAREFARLFEKCARGGNDGCIGSRWLPGAQVEPRQPLRRRIASRTFNSIARLLFGLPFADTQCGAKVFRRGALQTILGSLEVADFAFDIEVLWRLTEQGSKIAEIPTVWADRAAGTKIRLFTTSWKMLKTILRMRLRPTVLWRLPFFEFFACDSIIPVRRHRTSLLVLLPPSFEHVSEARKKWVAGCIADLRAHGCNVVLSRECVAYGSRGDFGYWAGFWRWYACVSKREYDAIVEVASGVPSMLPAVSMKRRFVWDLRCTRGLKKAIYDLAYGRLHATFEFEEPPELVARGLMESIGAGALYRAAFHEHDDGWALRYNDLESGSWTLQTLK